MVAANSSGLFVADPASGLLTSTSAFSRAKTLSACLQLEYLGALSAIQGQVAVVPNFSLNAFNNNAGGTGLAFPTVDEIFGYASERDRFQIDGHEAIWRPNEEQSVFRTDGGDAAGLVGSPTLQADSCFWSGNAAVYNTVISCPNPGMVTGMCIAWRGAAATANTLTFNIVKVVELELAARNGQIEIIPPPSDSWMHRITDATAMLDRNFPGWQRGVVRGLTNVATTAARAWSMSFARNATGRLTNGY